MYKSPVVELWLRNMEKSENVIIEDQIDLEENSHTAELGRTITCTLYVYRQIKLPLLEIIYHKLIEHAGINKTDSLLDNDLKKG